MNQYDISSISKTSENEKRRRKETGNQRHAYTLKRSCEHFRETWERNVFPVLTSSLRLQYPGGKIAFWKSDR